MLIANALRIASTATQSAALWLMKTWRVGVGWVIRGGRLFWFLQKRTLLFLRLTPASPRAPLAI